MAQSALLGNTPATSDDKVIAVAIKALAGSEFFPNKAHPYGQPRPSSDPPDPTNGSNIVGLAAFFIAITFVITAGRLIIRWRRKRVNLGLDDFFVVPAAATAIVCDVIVLYISLNECYMHHIYWCTYEEFAKQYEMLYVNQTIFWVALYFAKISIVFNNRRLTTIAQGWWQTGHWVVLGIICSCFALAILTTIFECSPVKSHYNLIDLGSLLLTRPKSLHCIDSTKLELANRWLHVVTDLMLLSVPLIILYKLQMPWRKKFSVGFIFCFGIVCCVASIMRNEVWTHPTDDFTFDSRALLIWDLIDVNFAPIVASLPVYYPVLNWVFQETTSKLAGCKSIGKGLSQYGKKSANNMASLKGKIFQHDHHKIASPSLSDIKGPYIKADGTWIHTLAGGGIDVTNDVQQPITQIRNNLRQDTAAAHRGSLTAERIEKDEFELEQVKGDEEEGLRTASHRF